MRFSLSFSVTIINFGSLSRPQSALKVRWEIQIWNWNEWRQIIQNSKTSNSSKIVTLKQTLFLRKIYWIRIVKYFTILNSNQHSWNCMNFHGYFIKIPYINIRYISSVRLKFCHKTALFVVYYAHFHRKKNTRRSSGNLGLGFLRNVASVFL